VSFITYYIIYIYIASCLLPIAYIVFVFDFLTPETVATYLLTRSCGVNSSTPAPALEGIGTGPGVDRCNSPGGGPLQQSRGWTVATVQGVDRCSPEGPLQQSKGWTVAAQGGRCNSPGGGPLQQSRGWTVAAQRGRCNSPGGGPLQPRGAVATVQGVDRCNSPFCDA
jgi:hypothetical protein